MTSRHLAIPVRLSISLISELKLAIWEGGEQVSEMETHTHQQSPNSSRNTHTSELRDQTGNDIILIIAATPYPHVHKLCTQMVGAHTAEQWEPNKYSLKSLS